MKSSKVSQYVSWERTMFCGLLTGCQQAWNWQAGWAGPNFKRTDKITNKINCSNYIWVKMYSEPLVSDAAEEAGSILRSISPSLTCCQGKELRSAHTPRRSLPEASTQVSGIKNTMAWINKKWLKSDCEGGRWCRGSTLQPQTLPADSVAPL